MSINIYKWEASSIDMAYKFPSFINIYNYLYIYNWWIFPSFYPFPVVFHDWLQSVAVIYFSSWHLHQRKTSSETDRGPWRPASCTRRKSEGGSLAARAMHAGGNIRLRNVSMVSCLIKALDLKSKLNLPSGKHANIAMENPRFLEENSVFLWPLRY